MWRATDARDDQADAAIWEMMDQLVARQQAAMERWWEDGDRTPKQRRVAKLVEACNQLITGPQVARAAKKINRTPLGWEGCTPGTLGG